MPDHLDTAGSQIVMFSGRLVDPLDLKAEDLSVLDIAHHLSNMCRFSGATRKFYSVAEHSVRVTRWVRAQSGSIEEQRWALLHDASEAYLQDLPTPLKKDPKFGRSFRVEERRVESAVAKAFELDGKIPALVHLGDKAVFGAEVRDLMPPSPQWELWPVPSEAVLPAHEIKPWGAAKAKRKFLEEFDSLFGALS